MPTGSTPNLWKRLARALRPNYYEEQDRSIEKPKAKAAPAPTLSKEEEEKLNRESFKLPADFLWGFATASYQIEGAVKEGGRQDSIWDVFCKIPGKVHNGDSGDVTTDSYHRWREDIALLKQYGAKAYRFSIAWPRIILYKDEQGKFLDEPKINEEGIKWYSDFIDGLLEANIIPLATLYHWDLPQALMEKYGGLLDSEQFPKDFNFYADVIFSRLGDRVKHWLTFNEPYVSTKLGYGWGVHAPGRTSDRTKSKVGDTSTEPWQCGHSILIAHGLAVKTYREKYQQEQKGVISITLNCDWGEPYSDSPNDIAAAQRYLDFYVGWFADPIYLTGDYPQSMRRILGDRLPKFTPEQSALIKGSYDFFGLNHYTARWIEDKSTARDPRQRSDEIDPLDLDGHLVQHTHRQGVPIGGEADSFWLWVCPWGFKKLLIYLWKRYGVPIYVTENGMSVKGETEKSFEEALNDVDRQKQYDGYLNEGLLGALTAHLDADADIEIKQNPVQVKSYFAWSLLDNFEWADGLSCRFGVTYVDWKTLERTPKKSSKVVTDFFRKHMPAQ